MFPETPVAVSEAAPLNLQVLLAAEQVKSVKAADAPKRDHQNEREAAESSEPELPECVVVEWEQRYFDYLTDMLGEAGCSPVDVHFILQRYGTYLIKYRAMFGTRPSLDNIRRKCQEVPKRRLVLIWSF